jgi:glycine dehydrogenase
MFDKFSDRHIGVTNPEDLKAMLAVIGVKSVDELIAQVIPQSIRLKQPLALPQGMSEYEFANHIQALAAKNRTLRSFIGMGYYPCAVPAAITRNVFENPAWYTSYTPYQAEISQGRLEALLNFQTAVISLTGMEIGNCSLLDEGTAAAEAMLMMFSLRSREAVKEGRNQLFVDRNIFPQTLDVLITRSERSENIISIASAAAVPSSNSEQLPISMPVSEMTAVWKFSSASRRPCEISA